MCSITDQTRGTARAARLATLIQHSRDLTSTIAGDLLDPEAPTDLAGSHVDAVASQLRGLVATIESARAAAAVLTSVIDRAASSRQLIEGTYASTVRFLEVETGMGEATARALIGRAHDLGDAADNGDPRVRDAWLAGHLTHDKVRVLTVGIRDAVKTQPIAQRQESTRLAWDLLLPHAATATVSELRRAVARIRFVVDPDGVRQAELDAYTEQSLTLVPVGHLMRLQAFLDPQTAAAVMTVLDQQVAAWRRDDDLAPEDRLPDGVDLDSVEGRRLQRARSAHLRALALGEVMTGLLDRGEVGLRHGIRPHTVLTVDARDLLAGLGGELTMPGHDDPVLVSSDTVRRILCDTGLTTVITQPAGCDQPGNSDAPGSVAGRATGALPELLRGHAVDVLYVGREHRTAPPRLRRALDARDRHCQAPGCHRSAHRCHAHHVQHWEHGGDTSIANALLLCERHHRALHAGQLAIAADPTRRPTESGYFQVRPTERSPRP